MHDSTAVALVAALLGAREVELVAKHFAERVVLGRGDIVFVAVDVEHEEAGALLHRPHATARGWTWQ
jgi:hypothetical protein